MSEIKDKFNELFVPEIKKFLSDIGQNIDEVEDTLDSMEDFENMQEKKSDKAESIEECPSFKDFNKAIGLARNVKLVWAHLFIIILNKPHFYKVL